MNKILLLSHGERKIYSCPQKGNIYYENYYSGNYINNICPYIFNNHFIQSFCKGIKKTEGDIYIWVFKKSDTEYLCDLVFIVEKIINWNSSKFRLNGNYKNILEIINFDNSNNYIDIYNEEILFRHFYKGIHQHNWSRNKENSRIRINFSTAIATKESFQPRSDDGNLINIYDYFIKFHEKELKLIKSKRNIGIKFDLLQLKGFNKDNFLKWINKKGGKNKLLGKDLKNYRVMNLG